MALLTSALERSQSEQNSRLIPWLVCISGGLLFFYEFMQLNIFGSLNTSVMKAFTLNAQQLGNLSSISFYADASLIFVAGNLLDRFSTRKLILLAMLSCSLGTLAFAASQTLTEAVIARIFVGVGGAFCFLSGVKLSSRWFPPKRMALLVGIIVTMAMIGGWFAQAPMSALIHSIGWREAVLFNGLLGLVITAWIWLVVKDRPQGEEHMTIAERSELKQAGLWYCIMQVLKNAQNWKAAFYTCLMNLPIFLLGAFWGSLYLEQIHHFTPGQATSITGMLFFGTIFGSPIMGWVSDKMQSRRIPMMIAAVISFVFMLLVIYEPGLSYGTLLILFFLLGFVTGAQVIGYPVASESNSPLVTATAVSIVSMVTIFGGAIMQPISGWIIDRYWTGAVCNGVHCYSLKAYQHAMLIMLASFVIALVLAFFLKETACRPYQERREHN